MERLPELSYFESSSWSGQEAASKMGLAECKVQEHAFALAKNPISLLK
jgi:hypothetical protein